VGVAGSSPAAPTNVILVHAARVSEDPAAFALMAITTAKLPLSFAKAVVNALPRRTQRYLHDLWQGYRRRHPVLDPGMEQYGLTAAQVYPEGDRFDESLRAGIVGNLEGLVIRKETPVASIGSCFAEEFALHMRESGFNYLVAESHVFPSSANWGRVYTIPGFRQVVMYSTADSFPLAVEPAPEGWFDPLREARSGFFPTPKQAEEAIRVHRSASRKAFEDARVLILTLGQNEAWVDRRSGLVWARRPPQAILDEEKERFEVKAFSFEENASCLEDALMRLHRLNEQLDILLTVSPVPSGATFFGSEVVTQSFAGKCTLRAVAERICRVMPRVWYFPSFEMTLAYNPHTLNADNRHVKNATIDRIFKLLHDSVVR
jgi:hypothetical protein